MKNLPLPSVLKKSTLLIISLLAWSCGPNIIAPSADSKVHLALGNPTNATNVLSNEDNFLLRKSQYVMSYNNSLHHANWVSWELSAKWIGPVDRSDDFRPDDQLPSSFYKVLSSDYTSSGFDRGHLCPSADRTRNQTDNSATFVMSNMIPQSPELNREAWANLESYCRRLSDNGYLLYIIAGAYGTGGDGSKGKASNLKNDVNVPARVYKVILATNKYSISDIDKNTIIIAADFPNSDEVVTKRDWVRFLTTPAEIEKNAKINLFDAIPSTLRSDFKERLFEYQDSEVPVETSCKLYNNRPLYIGTEGGCFYYKSSGSKSYVDKKLCDCE